MIALNNHADYMSAMGIEVWRLRQTSPILSPTNVVRYFLFNAKRTISALLVAEVGAQQRDQESELLSAILRALAMTAEPASDSVPSVLTHLILLGAKYPPANPVKKCQMIETYSLAQMLENPLLKAKVWQSLSKLILS